MAAMPLMNSPATKPFSNAESRANEHTRSLDRVFEDDRVYETNQGADQEM